MDPKKQLTNLDPRLKETYDRVMGMNIPAAAPLPQASPTPQINTPLPPPSQPAPTEKAPKPSSDAVGVVTTIHTEEVKQMEHTPTKTVLKHTFSPATYLLIAVGLFLFFAIYTVFWFKYFNMPIPFISSFI